MSEDVFRDFSPIEVRVVDNSKMLVEIREVTGKIYSPFVSYYFQQARVAIRQTSMQGW